MALIDMSGWDFVGNTVDISETGWNLIGGGGGGFIQAATSGGRNSGGCIQFQRGNGGGNGTIGFMKQYTNQGLSGAHSFFGLAYSAPSASQNTMFAISDSGLNQIAFITAADGSLSIERNNVTVIGSAPAGTLNFSGYHYHEFDVVIGSGTSGSAVWKVDGTTVVNATGVNTQNTANASWNQLLFGSGSSANQAVVVLWSVDDFYYCDATGSAPYNTNLGDVRVVGDLPNGAGTYAQMTKVGSASTHWQSVNEKPTDLDTTYVSSSTINQQDTYVFPSLPANTNTVLAVAGRPSARKDDAGFRTIETHLRSTTSGLEADTAAGPQLPLNYLYQFHVMTFNPITGLAWTVADVNNMELGPKLAA